MLDANLKDQLKAYLERVSLPFEIVASLDDGEKSQELLGLLNDIVSLTDKITLKTDGNDARRPSFALNRPGEDTGVVFAGDRQVLASAVMWARLSRPELVPAPANGQVRAHWPARRPRRGSNPQPSL